MSISISSAAAEHITRCLQERGQGEGLRVKIKPSGCSGFSYVLDFADRVEANDAVFEAHGVKIIVDRDSLPMMDGTEVDYVTEGLNRYFRFNNPKVKDECGCGESFSV
ncbi:HesB/IscA family protein [Marinospirillum alkaliphilum]|uniref:Iron-sulfur cluster assembly protein n=1 Tax=Marinospirillum alkaliphilum DSM 21637 TaxID=1122209 RepID=A0A1K1UXU6_9GAMM|nr:iron-sulfur cluster assembly accessory protein [Marinospirillum alkaliphilum]SFX17647.1 iron-sulfur cluster assembly protein [Marinospirillum alkaliphilum DSM 21637]